MFKNTKGSYRAVNVKRDSFLLDKHAKAIMNNKVDVNLIIVFYRHR